jgi:hypothetical protein
VSFGLGDSLLFGGLAYYGLSSNSSVVNVVNWTDDSGDLDLASLTSQIVPEDALYALVRVRLSSNDDNFTAEKYLSLKYNDGEPVSQSFDRVAASLETSYAEGIKGEASATLVIPINNNISDNLSWRLWSNGTELAPSITTVGWTLYVEGYFVREAVEGPYSGSAFRAIDKNFNNISVTDWSGDEGTLDLSSLSGSSVNTSYTHAFMRSTFQTGSDDFDTQKILFMEENNLSPVLELTELSKNIMSVNYQGSFKSEESVSSVVPLNASNSNNVSWKITSNGAESVVSGNWGLYVEGYLEAITDSSPNGLFFDPIGNNRTFQTLASWTFDSGTVDLTNFDMPTSATHVMVRFSVTTATGFFNSEKYLYADGNAPTLDPEYRVFSIDTVYDGVIRGENDVTVILPIESNSFSWVLSSPIAETSVTLPNAGFWYSIEGYFVSP